MSEPGRVQEGTPRSGIYLNGRAAQLLTWIVSAIFAIGQGLIAWTLLELYSMNGRILTVEANRWTSKDQANFARHLDDKFSKLPPQLFVDYVESIDRRVGRLEDGSR